MVITLRSDFNIQSAIVELEETGGTSFPLLSDDVREYLLAEALRCSYQKRDMVVGPAQVQQDLSGVDAFPPDSPFFTVRDVWQSLLQQKLADLSAGPTLFSTPLQFTELSLQRYDVGSRGITPHLDGRRSINLICVFTLMGCCRFCVCEDRSGKNPISLDASPGNAVLLRAPGFRGSGFRPFHFLTDIQGPRISFGLRQHVDA